ncbi:MAG: hypothetical protein HQL65_11825 [Magnetococcales bacterium]|nr:hypothetical protein [Magnetococcales bacterium]
MSSYSVLTTQTKSIRGDFFKMVPLLFFCFLLLFLNMFEDTSHRLGGVVDAQTTILDQMNVRTISSHISGLEERKKLRWLYKSIEFNIYKKIDHTLGNKAVRLAFDLHYSLHLLASLVFCILISLHGQSRPGFDQVVVAVSAYLLIYYYVFSIDGYRENYTYIELTAISMALYASLEKKIALFLFAVFLGVANRETGIVMGLIYPLLNWQKESAKKMVFFILFGPLLLVTLNLDLFMQKNFYNLALFISKETSSGPSLFHLSSIPPGTGIIMALKYGVFFAPLSIFLPGLLRSDTGKKWILIFLLYVAVIALGSYLGNYFLLNLLIPFYIYGVGLTLNNAER